MLFPLHWNFSEYLALFVRLTKRKSKMTSFLCSSICFRQTEWHRCRFNKTWRIDPPTSVDSSTKIEAKNKNRTILNRISFMIYWRFEYKKSDHILRERRSFTQGHHRTYQRCATRLDSYWNRSLETRFVLWDTFLFESIYKMSLSTMMEKKEEKKAGSDKVRRNVMSQYDQSYLFLA